MARFTACMSIPAHNKRVSAASLPLVAPRVRRLAAPVGRYPASPNSAALKNASVFGAPELQIPTAVMRQNGVIRHSKQASAGGAPELGTLYQWRKLPLSWHLLGKLALD